MCTEYQIVETTQSLILFCYMECRPENCRIQNIESSRFVNYA